jgi:transketolase
VIRPADANETSIAWRLAIESTGPVALVLTRQNVPVLDGTAGNDGVARGAYVLRDADGEPDIVLIGTGSEVQHCLAAADTLAGDGVAVRVVSMPSWELFAAQDDGYQVSVLPVGVPRVSVEAGSTFGWSLYADASVGIDHFGASAPGGVVMEQFGITPENVVAHAKAVLATG